MPQDIFYPRVNIVDESGEPVNFDNASGDKATAINQTSQIQLETSILNRLPNALVNGRLAVDVQSLDVTINNTQLEIANDVGNPIPVGGTVAISGTPTVTANIGTTGTLATEATLQQVKAAIQAQIAIASTIFTDNSGTFYVRRDSVNEGTGAITVAFTDPTGTAATPGAGLRPLATTDKDVLTDFYDVLTSSTSYSVGDLLARVAILDVNNTGSPSATFIWLNLTTGTILSSAPTSSNIERANENIGARQVGPWSVGINNYPATQAISAASLPLPSGAAKDSTLTDGTQRSKITDGTNNVAVTNTATIGTEYGIVIRVASSALPTDAAQEHTVATSPNATRLTDGTSFYKPTTPADTQPISVANLPLPAGAATDITLQQVRDAIKAQIDIASTIWTDNSGAFYVRRDLVNEGTSTITVVFTDPSGVATTPGAGLRPLSTEDKDILTDFYDVTTSGTGYSVGDLLSRVAVLDVNSGTPTATFVWLNLTAGTILSSAPTSSNIERANENIGARQVGVWSVGINNYPATQPISAVSLPLPTGAAAEHTTASSPHAARLTDGTNFYKPTTPSDTQPISAVSLPLPAGAATDITLQQVRDAIKTQIDIASTIWTDNSGAFYVRRDLINEGTSAITVAFTDPSGNTATPGAGLRPLATSDKDTLTDFYDVLTSSTGYSVGDLLARAAILDVNNTGSPFAVFIWLNLTAGTILSSPPASANIERANENIGARQIGNWTVAINTLPVAFGAGASSATTQRVIASSDSPEVTRLISIDSKTPSLGSNTTANSQSITIASDDAIALAIRDRLPSTIGSKTAANSLAVALATDGIFAAFAGLASDSFSATGSVHAKLGAIASSQYSNWARLQTASDLSQTFTYLDAGTSDERINTIAYTSTAANITIIETYIYAGNSGAYRISSIVRS